MFIHSSVICQTTGPQPLPKRLLHLMRSRASSFKWQYPLLSPRSSSNCLRLWCYGTTNYFVCLTSPMSLLSHRPWINYNKNKYVTLKYKLWSPHVKITVFWNMKTLSSLSSTTKNEMASSSGMSESIYKTAWRQIKGVTFTFIMLKN
jgi:hypothetical protein